MSKLIKCKHRGCDFTCRLPGKMRGHYNEFPKHHPRNGVSLRDSGQSKSRKVRGRSPSQLPTRPKTKKLRALLPFCTDCGTRAKSDWKFCGRCGTKLAGRFI